MLSRSTMFLHPLSVASVTGKSRLQVKLMNDSSAVSNLTS